MRIAKTGAALLALAFGGVVVASCVGSPDEATGEEATGEATEPLETDETLEPGVATNGETSTAEAVGQAADSDEATGEARQEIEFAFRPIVQADPDGGGWQEARVRVLYADWRARPVSHWTCSYIIGMPLRMAELGKKRDKILSAKYAARVAGQAESDAADEVLQSRPEWTNVTDLFCIHVTELIQLKLRHDYKIWRATAQRWM